MSAPTHIDLFCGFGGSSIGLREAGFELRLGANHWDRAIETHAANFRDADHFQGDISGYDMRRLPKADLAWISPECTWHSPAGGRKRVRAELDLFDDYVPDAAGERSRATMWDVVRAAEAKQFKIVLVENVVEVASWPLFETWLLAMDNLGYDMQILCVSAAHIGSPTNPYAPQWRDRVYFAFYKRGVPMPRLDPRPIAWCPQCDTVVESVQSWKREDRRRIGKYGAQYVYVCAAGQHSKQIVEPFVLPAASAIDWTDLGTRIADRERPLVAATMRRIEAGIRMFSRPIVTAAAGQTYDAASDGGPRRFYRVAPADGSPLDPRMTTGGDGLAVPPLTNVRHGEPDHGRQYLPGEQPFQTAQTKIGDGMVTPPMIVAGYDYQGGDERRVKAADGGPLGTVVANGRGHHELVVPPFAVEMRGTSTARGVIEDALGAVTAGGNHHGLTIPEEAFLSRAYGSRGSRADHLNTSVDDPMHAITASGGNHALVIPYRRGRASRASEGPLPTQTTSNTTALVEMIDAADMRDIVANSRFRMLGPREHLRAQRFPDDYEVRGNKGEQTKGAGNAVASNVAHYLGAKSMEALT